MKQKKLGTLATKSTTLGKFLREFREKSATLGKLLREFWAKLREFRQILREFLSKNLPHLPFLLVIPNLTPVVGVVILGEELES